MNKDEWVKYQDSFIEKFGWKNGVKIMLEASSKIKGSKPLYELNEKEDALLKEQWESALKNPEPFLYPSTPSKNQNIIENIFAILCILIFWAIFLYFYQ